MKLKALLLALFVAGLTASYALADDGHGKGKGKGDAEHGAKATTVAPATRCRPAIELELRGTLASAPTATAVAVLVTKGGAEGQSLAGKQLTLDVTGARVAAGLTAGSTVQVKGRACVDIVAGTVKLVAQSVQAKRSESPTTSTSTSTTTSTAATTTR
jgi:hypothetical protein